MVALKQQQTPAAGSPHRVLDPSQFKMGKSDVATHGGREVKVARICMWGRERVEGLLVPNRLPRSKRAQLLQSPLSLPSHLLCALHSPLAASVTRR